jgi:hypothetical protein
MPFIDCAPKGAATKYERTTGRRERVVHKVFIAQEL